MMSILHKPTASRPGCELRSPAGFLISPTQPNAASPAGWLLRTLLLSPLLPLAVLECKRSVADEETAQIEHLLAQQVGEAIACIRQRQSILETPTTTSQRTVFVISVQQTKIQLRRIPFTEEYLAAVRENKKPSESLLVRSSQVQDLPIPDQRRVAIELLVAFFDGIQNNPDWTHRFGIDICVVEG
ncbi:hypothetical protein FN846DRAFT_986490 [Sphaerosporella brunnea]|uniref:Uncharacterized protein n=1 Tax=Sphaerosporella brunnea TaxID=1250544 RepID=A0A5J5F9I4_9PEZI|nr:hypothetical protein FN846DRAFT_986490 [Sphaerosporella brunnea]